MCAAEAPFEQPLADLRRRIEELEGFPEGAGRRQEITQLEKELAKKTREIYSKLSRWDKTLVARHADRPYTNDYIANLTEEWLEIHGDRAFADDPAIVAGFARYKGRSVAIVGHQKGRSTQQRIARNFGQPRPEGYRKALRVMHLAERYALPLLTFIDTPGAYPGIGAEERGQAQAIAQNLLVMAGLKVPIVVTVTGEGGSGGALALGVGNRVLMLQYSIYSVISPEGCAAILWKDQAKREDAAEAMKISAQDLAGFGIIDEIIEEPLGGAHTDVPETCHRVGEAIDRALDGLAAMSAEELVAQRYERFRNLGVFVGG
jgi:acetyl-CoA carboxylase carboxyl transferase subunit alpha